MDTIGKSFATHLKDPFQRNSLKCVCVTQCRTLLNVDLSKDYNLALEINVSQNNSIWETLSSFFILSQELRGLSHSEGGILSNRRNKKPSVPVLCLGTRWTIISMGYKIDLVNIGNVLPSSIPKTYGPL